LNFNYNFNNFNNFDNFNNQNYRNRMIHIINILNCHLRDIEILKIAIFEKLNDWIIYGLKNENDTINNCIKDIKYCV